MKLTNLLKESSYGRGPKIGEESEKGMTNEEKREFLNAVSEYKKFGESIYRAGDLAEVYESIKGIVETAHKVTLEETGDWFDKVTVGRHMKSMNESFKVFTNTIKEVNTLQQRLESCYDEMGEVLGKYYEIKEGNEFGAARAKAIANGDDEFEVDGKEFPVKDVDKDDKENAKEFAKESVNEESKRNTVKLTGLLNEGMFGESVLNERAEPMLTDKEQEIVRKALQRATGVDVDSEVSDTRYHGGSSDFAFEGGEDMMMYVGKYDDEYTVSIESMNGQIAMKDAKDFKSIVKEAMKMAKKYKKKLTTESKSMKLTDVLSENKYSIIDPKGNQKGVGPKDAANKMQKKLGGSKKGYFVVPAKFALKARRAMEKYKFDFKNPKLQDIMSDLYFEGVEKSVVNEGFATWEMRFSDMNLGGVKLSKKDVYKVKARNTVEAIKKAAKMAGIKGKDWVATETHSLKKIG